MQNVISSISAGRHAVTGSQATEKLDQFTKNNNIDSNVAEKVQAHVIAQGLSANNVRGNIQDAGRDLKEVHEKVISDNSAHYKIAKGANKAEESQLQAQVNRYEDNRLSKLVGIGGADKSGKVIVVDKGIYEKAKTNK